jgi:hypothetical protein
VNDVEAFEVDPHGMGWIREPSVSESVGSEQITELVMRVRLWDSEDGYKRNTNDYDADSDECDSQALASRESRESRLQRKQDRRGRMRKVTRRRQNQSAGRNHQGELDQHVGEQSEPEGKCLHSVDNTVYEFTPAFYVRNWQQSRLKLKTPLKQRLTRT